MPPKQLDASKSSPSKAATNKPSSVKAGSSSGRPAQRKTTGRGKSTAEKKVAGAMSENASGKKGSRGVTENVTCPTVEDRSATKIQRRVRVFLAKRLLANLKMAKCDYDKRMEELERKAWLELVERDRAEAERIRQKEELERQKRRLEALQQKQILEAAYDGDLALVKAVIKEVEAAAASQSDAPVRTSPHRRLLALINCKDANGNTPLSEACAGGHLPLIKFLIDNGALVNSIGHFSRTPLYRAAFGGHLDAVKCVLELGGDPRIRDVEGMTPEQISPSPEIAVVLQSWNIADTERILKEAELKRESLAAEEMQLLMQEQARLEDKVVCLEKEYRVRQKTLQKAHEELNKRIFEHDQAVSQGFERTDITLKAIEEAELVLVKVQREELETRQALSQARADVRSQKAESDKGEEHHGVDDGSTKCNVKELSDVLLNDVGNKIRTSGKSVLLVDPSMQAVTFLRYRDTNYLNMLNLSEAQVEPMRKALLGAIRFGKPCVFDTMDVDMMDLIEERLEGVQKGLFNMIVTGAVLENDFYLKLVREGDGDAYKKTEFNELFTRNFRFMIVTKQTDLPCTWLQRFYVIRVVLASQ